MKSEEKIQAEIIKWFDTEYPEYRGLLYHNFLNPSNARQGAKLVALGLKKGIPDLTLAIPTKVSHGLYIELKNEKGRLQPHQKKQIEKLKSVGYQVEVVRSLEEFQELVKNYLLNLEQY